MLIGFFTNRDIFLNKLIPMLSVYLEQTRQCQALFAVIMRKQGGQRTEQEIKSAQKTFNETYEMANIILKELKSIQRINQSVPHSHSSTKS
mmetsp:Transcript_14153/g.24047  ORF Transcript_14153/g.24047 Transcript_14153/m.24047 type:complete len:91 (-) Transcript_14153:661-933(-)